MHRDGREPQSILGGGVSDIEILGAASEVWRGRSGRYAEMWTAATVGLSKVEMSYVVDR